MEVPREVLKLIAGHVSEYMTFAEWIENADISSPRIRCADFFEFDLKQNADARGEIEIEVMRPMAVKQRNAAITEKAAIFLSLLCKNKKKKCSVVDKKKEARLCDYSVKGSVGGSTFKASAIYEIEAAALLRIRFKIHFEINRPLSFSKPNYFIVDDGIERSLDWEEYIYLKFTKYSAKVFIDFGSIRHEMQERFICKYLD